MSVNDQQEDNAKYHRDMKMYSFNEDSQLTILAEVQPVREGTQSKWEKTKFVGKRAKIVWNHT